jgi:hypothetical protein
MDKEINATIEYEQPQVSDFGDLAENTLTRTTVGLTDVPEGTPGPGKIFSPAP